MINWLLDPRLFNILIVLMFFASAVRWAFEKNWAQAAYWVSAAFLNIAVLFMGKT